MSNKGALSVLPSTSLQTSPRPLLLATNAFELPLGHMSFKIGLQIDVRSKSTLLAFSIFPAPLCTPLRILPAHCISPLHTSLLPRIVRPKMFRIHFVADGVALVNISHVRPTDGIGDFWAH